MTYGSCVTGNLAVDLHRFLYKGIMFGFYQYTIYIYILHAYMQLYILYQCCISTSLIPPDILSVCSPPERQHPRNGTSRAARCPNLPQSQNVLCETFWIHSCLDNTSRTKKNQLPNNLFWRPRTMLGQNGSFNLEAVSDA